MGNKNIYAIKGFFWKTEDTSKSIPFQGVIRFKSDDTNIFAGEVEDALGKSKIKGFFKKTSLFFTQKYFPDSLNIESIAYDLEMNMGYKGIRTVKSMDGQTEIWGAFCVFYEPEELKNYRFIHSRTHPA